MSKTIEAPFRGGPTPTTSAAERLGNRTRWWFLYLTVLVVGLAIAALSYMRPYQPYLGLAWGCFAFLLATWIRFPRFALGATLALTLTGDLVTVWWFPFAKNLSSWESIMYLTDGVSLSPLEISMIWGLCVTTYRNLASTGRPFRPAPLLYPFVAFFSFALFGLAAGCHTEGTPGLRCSKRVP